MKLTLSMSFVAALKLINKSVNQTHTPASVYMAPTLTLDSVVKVPLSLHRLLGHNLKQVVWVGNDLCTDYSVSVLISSLIKADMQDTVVTCEAVPYHVPGEFH